MTGARGARGSGPSASSPAAGPPAAPRLRRLARRTRTRGEKEASPASGDPRSPSQHRGREREEGVCELCSQALGPEHRHLVDLEERSLLCACRACSLLFEKDAAGGEHYRLVPDRVRLLEDFRLSEADWLALRIPVDLAFFFRSSVAERVLAFYPGPMGATESRLGLAHWERLEERNPALHTMEPDVEALLVDGTGGERSGWLVPIDACYRLVGLIRTSWKGLAGGREVWDRIEEFFTDLRGRARVVDG